MIASSFEMGQFDKEKTMNGIRELVQNEEKVKELEQIVHKEASSTEAVDINTNDKVKKLIKNINNLDFENHKLNDLNS